jgi:chemotaxis protein MotB
MSRLRIATLSTSVVATLFALAGCVSQQTYQAQVQKTDALQQKYDELNQQMSTEIAHKELHIERLQNALRVTVNDQLLFPSGDWQMPADAQQSIAKIAKILAPMQQTKIVVNGYTDNVPIGPGLVRQGVTSNLILSQKRAENVAQFMIAQGVNPSLVSTQGFGDANPVASNDTPEGRAQNRRVEIVLAGSGN